MGVRGVSRLCAAAVVAAAVGGMGLVGQPASAAVPGQMGTVARTGPVGRPLAAATALAHPYFYRETVRYGARDVSPYQISHVFEVQIRLYRSRFFGGPITGYFGNLTLAAV